jgi:hypothetical protein
MMARDYGGALIFDGMYQCIGHFGDARNAWSAQLDEYLDGYAQSWEVPGYNLAHNITHAPGTMPCGTTPSEIHWVVPHRLSAARLACAP